MHDRFAEGMRVYGEACGQTGRVFSRTVGAGRGSSPRLKERALPLISGKALPLTTGGGIPSHRGERPLPLTSGRGWSLTLRSLTSGSGPSLSPREEGPRPHKMGSLISRRGPSPSPRGEVPITHLGERALSLTSVRGPCSSFRREGPLPRLGKRAPFPPRFEERTVSLTFGYLTSRRGPSLSPQGMGALCIMAPVPAVRREARPCVFPRSSPSCATGRYALVRRPLSRLRCPTSSSPASPHTPLLPRSSWPTSSSPASPRTPLLPRSSWPTSSSPAPPASFCSPHTSAHSSNRTPPPLLRLTPVDFLLPLSCLPCAVPICSVVGGHGCFVHLREHIISSALTRRLVLREGSGNEEGGDGFAGSSSREVAQR